MNGERILQPTLHAKGNVQLTRHGVVTATFFVTALDYGLRPEDEKESVRAAHKSLIQAVPNGTVFMGIQAPLDLTQMLRDMIGSADIDDLDEFAEECAANFNRFRQIQPGVRVHLMNIPVIAPARFGSRVSQAWSELRSRETRSPQFLTEEQITIAHANAQTVLSKIDETFDFQPVPASMFQWLWEHNLTRGAHSQPAPADPTADSGFLPTRSVFRAAALDEGAQTDSPAKKRLPSKIPVIKVEPADADLPTSYQAMLAVRSFPVAGMAFPGGSEFLSLLDGIDKQREVAVDWAMWVERRSADQTVRKNSGALRRLNEQVDQRAYEQSFAQNSLMGRGAQLAEYTQHLEDSDGESEVVFTTVIAMGAETLTAVDEAVDKVQLAYKQSRMEWRRPVGAQIDLWSMFNLGALQTAAWRDYSHLTASDLWAGFVPFTSCRVGDRTGPIIGVNLLSGQFEPVHLDLRDKVLNNFSGCVAAAGDLGGGKSYFLKGRCLDIVDLGGQFLAIDTTAMGEYALLAEAITDSTEIDLNQPRVSLDPLRIFADDLTAGVGISLGTLLPLLGTDPMSAPGILMANLLSPAVRQEHRIVSVPSLHRYLAERADQFAGDSVEAELLRAMNAIAHLAPVLFDPDLPVLELTTPATVVRTHGVDLPTFEEMTTEHLYRRMGAPKLLGQAMLELTAVVARRAFLRPNGRFGALVTDEAHRMSVSPIGARVMRDFSTDGRKNDAALLMASQDPRSHFRGVDEDLIPTRLGFRQTDHALARGELEWLGIDVDANPYLLKQLRYNTSPMNAAGKVNPGREGECFIRDGRNRIGRIKTLSPARQARIDAISTTPTSKGRIAS